MKVITKIRSKAYLERKNIPSAAAQRDMAFLM